MIFTNNSEENLSPEDKLIFTLGSLIYPKHMLRLINLQINNKSRIKKDAPDNGFKLKNIPQGDCAMSRAMLKIYNCLYRFSLESLNFLVGDAALMCLFKHYFDTVAIQRLEDRPSLAVHKEAYIEAA